MRLDAKTAKTNADKEQLFAESVEKHFGIQSDNFDSNHFDEVNQFIEDNYEYFYPPEVPDDYRSDMDDDHDLVADIDSDAKTAKTDADKEQLFAESVERHFGIQSDNFDSNHFDEVNHFIEDNYEYFYLPEDPR